MLHTSGGSHGAQSRSAFTLIELLVVVAIIAILGGLVGAAVIKMIPTQQRKNSEQTIIKINALLKKQWSAVVDQARDEARQMQMPLPINYLAAKGAGNFDPERAKVLWIKFRLKQQFPMSYAEALGIDGTPPNQTRNFIPPELTYVKALNQAGITAPSGNPKPSEMSACLLMALSVNRRGVQVDQDILHALEMRDTDGDGLNEIVDGWGQPLAFLRFPIKDPNLPTLNPSLKAAQLAAQQNTSDPTARFFDPQDPEGRLQDPLWTNSNPQGYTIAATLLHPFLNMNVYHIPIIVSNGPDKKLGLDLTTFSCGAQLDTTANDDIYSYDLR